MRKYGVPVLFFVIGLVIFSYGIAMAIQVKYLGIHPWDVLNVTLHQKFGLTIGTWNIIVGMILVAISLMIDRKYVNIGTFLNAILVGVFVDFFNASGFFIPAPNIYIAVLTLLIAIALMGIGGGIYASAGLGAGPRDGFMLSLSEKLGFKIRTVRIVLESCVLILGLILGGPVFIFTFVFTFIQSPIFQFSFLNSSRMLEVIRGRDRMVDDSRRSS